LGDKNRKEYDEAILGTIIGESSLSGTSGHPDTGISEMEMGAQVRLLKETVIGTRRYLKPSTRNFPMHSTKAPTVVIWYPDRSLGRHDYHCPEHIREAAHEGINKWASASDRVQAGRDCMATVNWQMKKYLRDLDEILMKQAE